MEICKDYTLKHYEETLQKALVLGYKFVTCIEYFFNHQKYKDNNQKIFINRVDVDLSCKKAKKISDIFKKLDISGTFFNCLRLEVASGVELSTKTPPFWDVLYNLWNP